MNKTIISVKIIYPEKINFSSFYHPFRCETKSFHVNHVDNVNDADIVYENIYSDMLKFHLDNVLHFLEWN